MGMQRALTPLELMYLWVYVEEKVGEKVGEKVEEKVEDVKWYYWRFIQL